jgi:hypothetical protein
MVVSMRFMTWRPVLMVVCALLVLSAQVAGRDRASDTEGASAANSAASIHVWPGWRGLTAEGRVPQRLPTTWSASEGIRWKTLIPGGEHSSPIVFGSVAGSIPRSLEVHVFHRVAIVLDRHVRNIDQYVCGELDHEALACPSPPLL